MRDVLPPVLSLLVVILAALVIGRGLARLLHRRALGKPTPEALLVWLLHGTAVLVLAAGSCSHLGLTAPQSLWVLAFLLAAALVVGGGARRPVGAGIVALLGAAFTLAAGVVLLPELIGSCGLTFNDTYTYLSHALWLQDHSFAGATVFDPERVLGFSACNYRANGLRMGASFLLASCKAACPAVDAMVFVSVLFAWATILNLAGVYLLARWGLGLGRLQAALTACAGACAVSPLYVTVRQGFLPQQFGTAFFLFCLALLSRSSTAAGWRPRRALALALAAAALLSCYSELTPLLAVVGAGWLLLVLCRAWRKRRLRRLAGFFACVLPALVLFGNIEFARAFVALKQQMVATAGGHAPWGNAGFIAFALGGCPYHPQLTLTWQGMLLLLLTAGSFLLGVWRLALSRRAYVVGFALAVFVALAVYFRYFVVNPFIGGVGQTWSLYKLSKWVFPLALVVQAHGLAWLHPHLPWRRAISLGLCLLLIIASFRVHLREARQVAEANRQLFAAGNPTRAWTRLRKQLDRRGFSSVYYLESSVSLWPNLFASYLLYPQRMVNGWAMAESLPILRPLTPYIPPPANAAIVGWNIPFEVRGEQLPANLMLLDRDSPHIYRLDNATGLERLANGKNAAWLGPEPATLRVWSPRAGKAHLRLRILESRKEAGQANSPLRLRVGGDGTPHLLDAQAKDVDVVLRLPEGFSCIELACLAARVRIADVTLGFANGPDGFTAARRPNR